MKLTQQQVVHGLSIPIGKLGYHLPRTLSTAMVSNSVSQDRTSPQLQVGEEEQQLENDALPPRQGNRRRNNVRRSRSPSARPVYRIGGSVIPNETSEQQPTPSRGLELAQMPPGGGNLENGAISGGAPDGAAKV